MKAGGGADDHEEAGRVPADPPDPLAERLPRLRDADVEPDPELRDIDPKLERRCRDDAAGAIGVQPPLDLVAIHGIVAAAVGKHVVAIDRSRDPLDALPRIVEEDESVLAHYFRESGAIVGRQLLCWRAMGRPLDMKERQAVEWGAIVLLGDRHEPQAGQRLKVGRGLDDGRRRRDDLQLAVVAAGKSPTPRSKEPPEQDRPRWSRTRPRAREPRR